MIPSAFDYKRAGSVDEALSMLSGDAKFLAGGHSLVPAMKLRLNQPSALIDIRRIESLREIREDNGYLVIGSCATHAEISRSGVVRLKCPMLSLGAEMIGDVQVRNMGTIGGSLAHADPAADWPALVLAADAEIVLQSVDGTRTLAAEDFFLGFFETALREEEMITSVKIPFREGAISTYQKFEQPASRFAIVGCAVQLQKEGNVCKNVTIALTGVSESAFRDKEAEKVLEGHPLDETTINNVATAAAENVSILSDHYASEEYRKHLAKIYVKRALSALK